MMHSPYLSRGDQGDRTPENIVYTPSKIRSPNLTLEPSFFFRLFFGHCPNIFGNDRVFFFFFGQNDRKKFAIMLVLQLLFSSGDNNGYCTGNDNDIKCF